ncbi:MAG: succinate dehydrogenase assembly factor 2 [Pseudomonadota bacterium]
MTETHEIRLRRLRMRAGHRGTREMDIILGTWAIARLDTAGPDVLDVFEALLDEADQDLYLWVSGQAEAPATYRGLVADLAATMDVAPRDRPNLT